MSTTSDSLRKAVQLMGGQAALGRQIGASQQRVSHWLRSGTLPAEFARPIERATKGAVTARELRPDIFAPAKPRKSAA